MHVVLHPNCLFKRSFALATAEELLSPDNDPHELLQAYCLKRSLRATVRPSTLLIGFVLLRPMEQFGQFFKNVTCAGPAQFQKV
jgi:hypothetical protein